MGQSPKTTAAVENLLEMHLKREALRKVQNGCTLEVNLLGKLLTSARGVSIDEDSITIYSRNAKPQKISNSSFIDIPTFNWFFWGNCVSVRAEHKSYRFQFLRRGGVREAFGSFKSRVLFSLTAKIREIAQSFDDKARSQYLRDSDIPDLDHRIAKLIRQYQTSKASWVESLSTEAIRQLNDLSKHFPILKSKDYLRTSYEKKRLTSRKAFYDNIERNPLTDSQREAVIRNNDRNLVLAAAGTGKTSVMVAKYLDLVDAGECGANDILVLAYNKSAAEELSKRITSRGEIRENLPNVSTFHALGRKILADSKIHTYMSIFAEDPVRLQMWASEWLETYVKSSPQALQNFISLAYIPVNPFDFKSKVQYDNYVRDNEYRTLQGERVKGFQELEIANWLFLNCVEYEYEAPFITKRRLEVGFDYRPDFHLKGTSIYIEHFGIDRHGNTRADIDREEYNASMNSKRQLHREMGTVLLETFHYDWCENTLKQRLSQQLQQAGVLTRARLDDEILEILNNLGFITEGAHRYLKCLQAIRTERLDQIGIRTRLEEKSIPNAALYAELLEAIRLGYVAELKKQDRIDFDDMIIRAIDCIKNLKVTPKWKHILVDEFQDISSARMELIEALVEFGPKPILTVVGDDWQSIYRFSGGKLELTTRFGELFGSHTLTILNKSFRYNSNIAEVAGTFVMQNPEQYIKQVITETIATEPQIYLLDSGLVRKKSLSDRVVEVAAAIREKDKNASLAILARYNYLLKDAKDAMAAVGIRSNIEYWSFHKSKGLEADHCILIGFFRGKTGFPNENKEEAVLEALLPSRDSYPHSEERRLFYVALTRTRSKSYLIADPMAPSQFIDELISPKYKINIVSKTFKEAYRGIFKCPVCTSGYFVKRTGAYGEFYSCTSGSVCLSRPRICEKCGAPSVDHQHYSLCNNEKCRERKVLCDRCGRPMKPREGRFGKFLGCTGYGIKGDQCTNTRKVIC